jgi:uncharacterized protein YggE
MMKSKLMAGSFFLATTLLQPAFAEESKMPRTLMLSGHGEVSVVPDTAVITLGVMTNAATARQSLDANTAAMNAVMEQLKAAEIEDKDIQTSNFMVNPRFDYSQSSGTEQPKSFGYDVSNTVSVTIRKLDMLGEVLDKVVSSGSNQINGIAFQVSKPDAATDEARKLAVADAQRKAKVYSEASGVALGDILSLSEGGSYTPPVPMMRAMKADASAVPVAAGEQAIGVDVSITWEIR